MQAEKRWRFDSKQPMRNSSFLKTNSFHYREKYKTKQKTILIQEIKKSDLQFDLRNILGREEEEENGFKNCNLKKPFQSLTEIL